MKKETAIITLEDYNIWRRGGDIDEMPDVITIGEAIDEAIKVLKESISEDSKPEPKRETGWYVVNEPTWEKYISYENLQDGTRYGLTSNGDWFTGSIGEVDWSCMTPATEDQIHTKIGNYIWRKGYKEGTRVKSMVTGAVHPILNDDIRFNNWSKCIMFGGVTIMKNGEWSKIIQTPSKEGLNSTATYGSSSWEDVRKLLNITKGQDVAIFTMEEFAQILSSVPANIDLEGIVKHVFSKREKDER